MRMLLIFLLNTMFLPQMVLAETGYLDIPGSCTFTCENERDRNLDYRDAVSHCDPVTSTPHESCQVVGSFAVAYAGCVASCTARLGLEKFQCTQSGGVFTANRLGMSQCDIPPNCPDGTRVADALEGVIGDCLCDNDPEIGIFSGEPVELCQQNVNLSDVCEGFKNGMTGAITDQEGWDENNCDGEEDAVAEEERKAAAITAATGEAEARMESAVEEAKRSARASCQSAVAPFKEGGSCARLSSRSIEEPPSFSSETTSRERCENLKSASEERLRESSSQTQSCINSFRNLNSNCSDSTALVSIPDTVVEGRTISIPSRRGDVASNSSELTSANSVYEALQRKMNEYNTAMRSLNSSADQCIAALEDKPDDDPTANKFLSQAQQFAGAAQKGLSSYSGGSGGYSSSELSSGTGYAAGRAIGDVAKGAYDKLRGRDSGSLSPSGGLGDNMAGISDEAVLGNGSGGQAYSPTGGASGGARSGGAKTTSAGNLRGNSSSNSKVGANARKKRRSKTAKARNLAQGYKTMKATDGGSSFSIKPSSFKKYGSKVLKQKLAEARKLHGKDMPLIFRNGKFVLDFLAMKESRGFKARTSAMESYLKGGQRKAASVADLHVHQDSKLNIFKIMNFRYQRQSFNKASD